MAGLEIGFLIFNATAEPGGPFLKIRLDDHLNNIQVNCIAPTQLVHWLGGEMCAWRRGGIVLVSSSGAFSAGCVLANRLSADPGKGAAHRGGRSEYPALCSNNT